MNSKIFILLSGAFFVLMPVFTFADTQTALYQQKISYLEEEVELLKGALQEGRANIPMQTYENIQAIEKKIQDLGLETSSTASSTTTGTSTPIDTTSTPQNTTASGTSVQLNFNASTAHITDTQKLGFINQIHKDWENIKPFYKIRQQAVIGGYEFVQEGNFDNVFVDILYYGNTLSGSYDAKLLYQFDTTTFQRTLVGFFEFDRASGWYLTRKGSNPFADASRQFVADPYLVRTPIIYSLLENANTTVNTTGTITTTSDTTNTSSANTTTSTAGSSEALAEIRQAYSDNKYITVIQKSNEYLEKYAANIELLSIRYRTYFIIAQYENALAIIKDIENKGWMTNRIACDGYAVATYAKNTTLAAQYKSQAGSSCEVLQ